MPKRADLQTRLGDIRLKNPIITASGTFGYGREYDHLMALNRLGGIVVKGLSLEPSKGNPPPRIVETPCGMLNAIGLENVGIRAFVTEKLPFLQTLDTHVFVNIYGTTIGEYAALAERIDPLDAVSGIEVNISCPNVKAGGVAFGVDPLAAAGVVKEIRKRTSKTMVVKLSPNVTDITEIAKIVEGEGADALSLINTITGMAVDIETRKPKLTNTTGGLSGPAIRPVAVRMVWQVCRSVAVPVIGIGGIMSAADALEFIIAGAVAVQVGTANFINPGTTTDIIDELQTWLDERHIQSISELIGTLEVG